MHRVAELGDPVLEPLEQAILLACVQRGSTTFVIDFAGLEQRVDNHENLMRHRHNRFLVSMPSYQGSPSLLMMQTSRCIQHPSTQQIEVRTAIADTLDHFQSIHLSF